MTTHTNTFAAHIFEYNMLGLEKLTRQHTHSNRAQKREQNVFFLSCHFCKDNAEKLKKYPKIKGKVSSLRTGKLHRKILVLVR